MITTSLRQHPFRHLDLRRVPLAAAIALTTLMLFGGGAAYAVAGEEPEGRPDFRVSVTDSPDPARAGGTVTYTAEVRNVGDDAGSGEADVELSGDVEVLSVRDSFGSCSRLSEKSYVCGASPGPGRTERITAVVRPRSGGTISATVTVFEESGIDPNTEDNTDSESTTVTGPPSTGSKCTVNGTPGDDVLRGTPGPDIICAGQGDDTIDAGDGNDVILAGPENDRVRGDSGNDLVLGGGGRDNLRGNRGNDVVRGDSEDDFAVGDRGNDTVTGGDGNDFVFGDTGRDLILGQRGDDNLTAVDSVRANDIADGGAGSDSCSADRGDLQSGCEPPLEN